jgi:hypothetical protein
VHGGLWLNNDHTFGVGGGGFLMEQKARFESVVGTAANGLTITRPYVDANTTTDNRPTASLLVARPGVATGSLVSAVSSRLSGADANLRRNVYHGCSFTADVFYGFRYVDLDESFTVFQRSVALVDGAYTIPTLNMMGQVMPGVRTPVLAGGSVGLTDRVRTRNQFYGGELGGRFEGRSGVFFAAVTPRIGLGTVHQITDITGRTGYSTGQVLSGGLLAAGVARGDGMIDGNIGRTSETRFAIAFDIGGQVGVQLSQNVRASVGYNLLYLNHVARPVKQLTPVINQRLIPLNPAFGTLSGPIAPQLTNDREQFHAHGLTVTVTVQY